MVENVWWDLHFCVLWFVVEIGSCALDEDGLNFEFIDDMNGLYNYHKFVV
jgi:hypothetical protein